MELAGILANINSFAGNGGNPALNAPSLTCGAQKEEQIAPLDKCSVVGIIFSKDRPYQLDQLLKSIRIYAGGLEYIHVLYTCTSIWASKYEEVLHNHPHVHFHQEQKFEQDLRNIIAPYDDADDNCNWFVSFLVDDLIFISSLDVQGLAEAVHSQPDIAAIQPKLHPGVTFCHPSLSVSHRPALSRSEFGYLTFPLNSGSQDWRYPFDLCGGIYRISTIHALLQLCQERSLQIRNPNVFEVFGNQLFAKLGEPYQRNMCCARPSMVVVTTNRVQDTYDVPTFSTNGGDLEALNNTTIDLDFAAYRNRPYFLVHIGQLLFEGQINLTTPAIPASIRQPFMSVVIPVFNGAQYIRQCIESLVVQSGVPFEVVIVDDGSTDETLQLLQEFKEQIVNDSSSLVHMNIIAMPHAGLVAALNTGIRAAQSNLIVRMDADDICLPDRLLRQYEYLCANPHITVLGTQAARLSDSQEQAVLTVPTHPVVVQWRLFFECPILHPTAAFRRDVVAAIPSFNAGIYTDQLQLPCQLSDESEIFNNGTSAEPNHACYVVENVVEDLELWLRIASAHPFSIDNLADIGLLWRSHPQQKSRIEFSKAHTRSTAVIWAYIVGNKALHIPPTTSIRHLHVLRKPTIAASLEELRHAYTLLRTFEQHICTSATTHYADKDEFEQEMCQYALQVVKESARQITLHLAENAMSLAVSKEDMQSLLQQMDVSPADILQAAVLASVDHT